MKLNLTEIQKPQYEEKGYLLPSFNITAMRENTQKRPSWLHFGAGNILRAFPCVLCQRLLEAGEMDTGMVIVETYDEEIIDKAFTPYDNLCLAVSLKRDGTVDKQVVASVAEAYAYSRAQQRVEEIFTAPSLQMVSMTITEKGYTVLNDAKEPLPWCAGDFQSMAAPVSILGILAKLLYLRYEAGELPLSMVSMDNCSHNGTLLKDGILAIATAWVQSGAAKPAFLDYLNNAEKVAFPWSMIDKITPRPSEAVQQMLEADGFEDAQLTTTSKNTYVSAMVNAEECEYLAIEDAFPNGRPPLQNVGVLFGDREMVDKIEKMKVCTCLNPLHTYLAIYGCLLGFTKISDEMQDATLAGIVRQLGYAEGLPVVTDPGVMNAKSFMDEVVELRFPNPFVPDTPQRIATDTSKKLPVRFGETLKAYLQKGNSDLSFLTFIPLVFAGYARYLTGFGDDGKPFDISPDPNLESLQALTAGYEPYKPFDTARLRPLFADASICGVDLYSCGLGQKAEMMFSEMNAGVGAIRSTLDRYLSQAKAR